MSSKHDDDAPSLRFLRVKKDIAHIASDPPPGIYVAPEENDITRIYALVVGPSGTPYEGGFLLFHLVCPLEYPINPPKVRFLTTDAGRARLHPYFYEYGAVSLSILGTFSGPQWSPAQSLWSLLLSIQSLLTNDPYHDQVYYYVSPVDEETDQKVADDYRVYIRHEVIRVAVCGAVESCLESGSSYPAALRGTVLKLFLENYDSYEESVKSHLRVKGEEINYPNVFPRKISHYEALLARLQGLKTKVEKRVEAVVPDANDSAQ
ncbi:hypothetical protein MTO96_027956 [Rhipicephalus appendiculatus]